MKKINAYIIAYLFFFTNHARQRRKAIIILKFLFDLHENNNSIAWLYYTFDYK